MLGVEYSGARRLPRGPLKLDAVAGEHVSYADDDRQDQSEPQHVCNETQTAKEEQQENGDDEQHGNHS